MRSAHLALIVLVLIVPLLIACDPGVQLGRACRYASECPPDLTCVVGRCGAECRVHRDCPLGSECLTNGGPGRCSFDDDRCGTCAEGLVCGDDGLCHSSCESCPSDGLCVAGACTRPAETDAGAMDASIVDASIVDSSVPDGSTGLTPDELHVPCTIGGAPCAAGMECVEDITATTAICRRPCTSAAECGNGRECVVLASGTSATHCSIPCDPLTADGCPAGEACDLLERQAPDDPDGGSSYVRFYDCRQATTSGTAGVLCDPGSLVECASGYTCYFLGADPACERWCRATTGSAVSPDCIGDRRCDPSGVAPAIDGTPMGVCVPR